MPADTALPELRVNVYVWRATLEVLRRAHLLDTGTLERAGFNFAGADVPAAAAARIATYLEGFLRGVDADSRVLLDGTVTREPDTYELYREDPARNYSAPVSWLGDFQEFCAASQGFEVQ